jgi:hypothetical protein
MARVVMNALLEDEVHPTPPWPKNGARIWQHWNDAYSKMLLEDADPEPVLSELQALAEDLVA